MAISGLIGSSPKLPSLLCLCLVTGLVPRMCAAGGRTTHRGEPQASVDPRPIRLPIIDGTDIRFTRLSTVDGLSRTKVGHIVQDDQGFMWFGTPFGLNRFDGYNFKVFVHDPEYPNSLSGVFINALFKDRDGTLWVGCDQFLNRFDRATETFTRYPIPLVNHISQDSAGMLWLAAPTGLYGLDPATGRIRHYSHDPNEPSSLSSNDVKSSGEDKGGRFWVANAEGLDEFDRRMGKVTLHIPLQEPSDGFSFYEDRFSVFWILHVSGNALAVFDRKTNTLTHYSFEQRESAGTSVTGVTAILEDQNGSLWLGTHGAGLLKFDRDHRRFIRYRNNPADLDSLPQDSVDTLFADREGSIWAAPGRMGLTRFATKPLPFRRFLHNPSSPIRTSEPFVGALYEDRQGILWIGTPEALNRIDRKAGQYTSYRLMAGPASRTDVITIREDLSGNLWVGTYGHGLLRFDRRTGQFKTYRHDPADPYSLSNDFVSRLLVDHNGTVWAGTGDGLNRLDAATGRFTTYSLGPQGGNSFYLELVEDRAGALWLGTDSSGLHRFDPATGHFTIHYQHDPNRPGTLSDNRVNSVHFDYSGTMWVGTQNGLNKLDHETGTFSVYTRKDGLPGNAVGCVLEDAHGDLWMSSNNGVATFNWQSRTVRSYSTADGLPGPDLTGWGACFKSPSGEMFFGGFGGATAFFPEDVVDLSYSPPIVLTDFRVTGNPVEIGRRSSLHTSISYASDLVLSHDQNVFSLTFAALSYANPATNRYRYKLEGLQRDWNEVSSDWRQAAYTTLPAGTYTFRAQGATSHGAWSEPGVALRIEILPPWWGTSWFRAVSVAVAGALLWMLYLLRLRHVAAGIQGRIEAQVAERERIARELHDTLLQGAYGLVLRFQAVADRIPQSEPARKMMDEALDRADLVIVEGRNRVEGLRTRAADGIDLPQAFTNVGNELAQDSGTELKVIVEGRPRALDVVVRDEAYWIGREALVNAFHAAKASRVELELAYGRYEFRLRLRDDGQGIDPRVLEAGGRPGHWGIRGMRERAGRIGAHLEISSRAGAGTEVDLRMTGSLAYRTRLEGSRRRWFRRPTGRAANRRVLQ
jgi:ligand-binding sensor domain-containing protein/signal transduction histidine kinase